MADAVICCCDNKACAREFPGSVLYCPFCGAHQPSPVIFTDPVNEGEAQNAENGKARAKSGRGAARPKPAETITPSFGSASASIEGTESRAKPVPDAAQVIATAATMVDGLTDAASPAHKIPVLPEVPPVQPGRGKVILDEEPLEPTLAITKSPARGSNWKTWLFAAAGIFVLIIWLGGRKTDTGREMIDQRIAAAASLVRVCKIEEAQALLESLGTEHAQTVHVAELQAAIKTARTDCDEQGSQTKAWVDTTRVIEHALQERAYDKAISVLNIYTNRWKEDDASRTLREHIDGQRTQNLMKEAEACLERTDYDCVEQRLSMFDSDNRPELEQRISSARAALHRATAARIGAAEATPMPIAPKPVTPTPVAPAERPVAAAVPAEANAPSAAQSESGPNLDDRRIMHLVTDGAQKMKEGNYKGAIDSMGLCLMLNAGSMKCLEMKQRAERLNKEMFACVGSGEEWVRDRCQ